MSDTVYWIWLAGCLGEGSHHLHYLLDRYTSAYDVFRAEPEELERLELGERIIAKLSDKDMREAYAINDYCASNKIGILTYAGEYYPPKLRMISDPPAVLYFRGKLPNTGDFLSIGMVGTRHMSEYGKRSAYKIAYELASAGITVVSGMALGVDAVASCGAIGAGGKTIAVLGTGVDVVYPPVHSKLYNKIIENGAVISEFPPTTEPRKRNFPLRNRIISGMTCGTLVVECDSKSGAMITAERAIEQGKDIFAIPGNLDSKNANGTNKLIHDGAQMVLCSDDILKNYEFYYGKTINYLAFSESKSHSDVDEGFLKSLDIHARGKLRREAQDEEASVIIERENILRPRKLPKNKDGGDEPSTLPRGKTKEEKAFRDNISAEAELASLSDKEKEIFLTMPDDRAIGVDALMRLGYRCSDVMGTLALLEIKGLVSSLPGGLYIKN